MEERFIGIDLGKRSFHSAFVDGAGVLEGIPQFKTSLTERKRFYKQLLPTDRIGIEACALAFIMAREIESETGAKVFVLNPGRLHMIFRSQRKTDKEDALKIARFIQSNHPDSLPIVSIPTEHEEKCRAIVSEMNFLSKQRSCYINRLHSIFVREGITGVTKSHLKTEDPRMKVISYLSEDRRNEAKRLAMHIGNLEVDIYLLEGEEKSLLSSMEECKYVLSIPGVGPKTAAAFLAHVGRGERFSSGSQVSNYIGFVPRVDISGTIVRQGHIHKRGCATLRGLYVQSAWALIRAKKGGDLKKKYEELSARIGKKKAIVAIARRMLELSWLLTSRKELFKDISEEELEKKLRSYSINSKLWDKAG